MTKGLPKRQSRKVADLAMALKLSSMQVWRLVQRGMPLDEDGARAWRAANIKTKAGALNDESARLKAAQADVAELQAAQLRSELIDVEEVNYVWSAGITAMVAQLDGLPGRMANELAGCTDAAQVELRLREETRRIRASLAEELGRIAFLAGEKFSTPAS